jgi:dTDP-4-dehydrorhamnose reductase
MNVSSTIDLINELIKFKSKIYFMSSVEVFDGKKGDYNEKSTPNPLNYYGKTKVIVEEYLKNNYQNYSILRTGWNVGISRKNKCVVSLTYETLLSEDAKMAFDNSFSITHAEDLVTAINKILFGNNYAIYHLSSLDIVKRTELADFIIKHSKKGNNMTYKKVPFSEIKYTESRGRQNNLKSGIKFVNEQMSFRSPYDTILEKVRFLDNLS